MCVCVLLLQSCLTLTTLWTVAQQSPLSIRFFKQEYWSGLSCPLPGGLTDPEIEPASLQSSALAGGSFTARATI